MCVYWVSVYIVYCIVAVVGASLSQQVHKLTPEWLLL